VRLVVVMAMVALLGGVARAEEEFDPEEWDKLATLEVHGSVSASIGDGTYDQLAIVVLDGWVELSRVRVLGGGTLERLTDDRHLGVTDATKIIDLWRARSNLDSVSLDVEETSGDARVAIYGRIVEGSLTDDSVAETTTTTVRSAPHRLAPLAEDATWIYLGEDEVDLIDDEIVIDKKKATWSQVKVVVVGDAVKLRTLDLHLGGKKSKVQTEELEQTYGDGDDSVVIDIPGKRRAIKKVRLQYKKHKLDASTRVQVYAR
jgi:hypothetical protein